MTTNNKETLKACGIVSLTAGIILSCIWGMVAYERWRMNLVVEEYKAVQEYDREQAEKK